ncbi:hypothetical protein, partial [uncultured Campylobacter sp.]|uniref:hypothetical protein n=1 Tax=uncultured Campylobacter sp. TaxID=218934 RepID=UPI0026134E7C
LALTSRDLAIKPPPKLGDAQLELSSKRLVSLKLYVEFAGLFVMFGLGVFMYFISDTLRIL